MKTYIYTFKNGQTSFSTDAINKKTALNFFKSHFQKFNGFEKMTINRISII